MTLAALSVNGLTIRDRQGGAIVADISFTIPAGSALTVIGETGSGKSLIAQALFGLLPETMRACGRISIAGAPAIDVADRGKLTALWRRQLMLVPQEPVAALDPVMRVRRQMALADLDDARIDAALCAVDLEPAVGRAFGFELSGGMAQRVVVATALGTGAPVVVADEPTKCLDPDRVGQVIVLLRRLLAEGRSLIVITHDRRIAAGLPGQLAVLDGGRFVEQDDNRRVLAAPRSDFAREWLAADPALWTPCARDCDMVANALSAHGLAFAWPGRAPLFRDLDLHLPRGAVLGVHGPSGCGKTTLGNVLLGLLRPTAGSIEWAGTDIVASPAAIRALRRRYQKLGQEPDSAFLPDTPLGRQFAMLRRVRPELDLKRDLPPLMESLKLHTSLLQRRPSEVSGGEAQRLAIARILLLAPEAIVADEPTSRLDPVVQREAARLLRRCVEERSLSLLLISHDKALLAAMADRTLDLGSCAGRVIG